jgi:hypothetical protein
MDMGRHGPSFHEDSEKYRAKMRCDSYYEFFGNSKKKVLLSCGSV